MIGYEERLNSEIYGPAEIRMLGILHTSDKSYYRIVKCVACRLNEFSLGHQHLVIGWWSIEDFLIRI